MGWEAGSDNGLGSTWAKPDPTRAPANVGVRVVKPDAHRTGCGRHVVQLKLAVQVLAIFRLPLRFPICLGQQLLK